MSATFKGSAWPWRTDVSDLPVSNLAIMSAPDPSGFRHMIARIAQDNLEEVFADILALAAAPELLAACVLMLKEAEEAGLGSTPGARLARDAIARVTP